MTIKHQFLLLFSIGLLFAFPCLAQKDTLKTNPKDPYELMSRYYEENFNPFTKGSKYVGFAFSLKDQKLQNQARLFDKLLYGEDLNYDLTFKGGYFLSDYTMVGGNFIYSRDKFVGTIVQESDTIQRENITSLGTIAPTIKTYFPLTKNHRLSFFNLLGLGFGFGNSVSRDTKIQKLALSSFATSDLQLGDVINLTDSVIMNVTAEDQTTVTSWTIKAAVASNTPQLSNSDFNSWYQASEGYYEPGESAETTIWGTGNPGTKLLGLIATTPLEIEDGNLAARMETLYNGDLAAGFGTPISAATICTGKFDPDEISITDPQATIGFGTPFAGRPKSFKIKYSFGPGAENKDKQGNPLSYGDACDIYILLEVRQSSSSKRFATAWFRSDEKDESLTQLQFPLTYGELPADAPDYSKPPNGQYVRTDSAEFILPTHLNFVATSSFNGANFAGAVGRTLIIDDLELIYE